MATPAPQRDIRDNQQEDNGEQENGPNRDIPLLYVPDLANSILSELIKDGMQVGNTGTQYIIPTPLLKDFVGIDKLKVTLPEGELETCSTPALDFVTKVPANTIQPTATERCLEGHEKGQPRPPVSTR